MNHEEVPLMFQAPIEGRCQLQRVEKGQTHPAYQWKEEWTKPYPKPQSQPKPKPTTQKVDPFARPTKQIPAATVENNPLAIAPQFGEGVETKTYRIRWRLATNCGQDETIIRPTIGAKGYPYFPGSGMKGVFRSVCTPAQAMDYCGGIDGEGNLQPGKLRFHGGYPIDTSWTTQLVDIVHSQEKKQVIKDEPRSTNANAQIALHRVTLRFGISATTRDAKVNWDEVWRIWEKALSKGLGSRVSAGYGYFEKIPSGNPLVTVGLQGQGIASTLLGKDNFGEKYNTPEFRPNMFKAALRGHTLRLLGGMTDEAKAKYLTKVLWGGFREGYTGQKAASDRGENAIVGLLGIDFEYPNEEILGVHTYKDRDRTQSQPIYNLENGTLRVVSMAAKPDPQLQTLAKDLVQFAMLLGGFGKSWRRIDHLEFYNSYTKRKPTIGCHWEFAPGSESFYLPVHSVEDVGKFIDRVCQNLRTWASKQMNLGTTKASHWREAWHHHNNGQGVEVWGRITNDDRSQAIHWFHGDYDGTNSIKKSDLTGKMGQTGRMWHRMYPHYQTNSNQKLKPQNGYVELLTIFPDRSTKSNDFRAFLARNTEFEKVW